MGFLMRPLKSLMGSLGNTELNPGVETLQGHFLAFPAHAHIRLIEWCRLHSEMCGEGCRGLALGEWMTVV